MTQNSPDTAIACIRHLKSKTNKLLGDMASERLLSEMLTAAVSGKITPLTGGKNNTLFLIEMNQQEVLFKLFGSHQTLKTIENTHQVVFQLAKQLTTHNHILQLPIPLVVNTKTAHSTPYGLCAVYPFLPGKTPLINSRDKRFALGALVGRLSTSLAMAKRNCEDQGHRSTKSNQQPLGDRYTDLPYRNHSVVLKAIESTWLTRIDAYLEQVIPALNALPCQLIHGDINASNLLEDSNGILTSVLDFEFTTYDTSAMELAVALASHGTDEMGTLQWEPILEGYFTTAHLSSDELEALPELVLLRRYDVVLHFIQRYGLSHPEVTHYLEVLRQCWNSLIANKGKAQSI